MYERIRIARDVTGRKFKITERQESDFTETTSGETKYHKPAKFFAPDGKQLIPEGHGFFRTAFGVRYELID